MPKRQRSIYRINSFHSIGLTRSCRGIISSSGNQSVRLKQGERREKKTGKRNNQSSYWHLIHTQLATRRRETECID